MVKFDFHDVEIRYQLPYGFKRGAMATVAATLDRSDGDQPFRRHHAAHEAINMQLGP